LKEMAMDAVLWTLSILLAVTYTVTGGGKLAAPRERILAMPGMGWVADVQTPRVRMIGALEVAGAVGVVVPWATGILPLLTPLAAIGLAAVQVGAIITHAGRGEWEHLVLNFVLLAAAVVVAVGRLVG
jgi:hypothetical protein